MQRACLQRPFRSLHEQDFSVKTSFIQTWFSQENCHRFPVHFREVSVFFKKSGAIHLSENLGLNILHFHVLSVFVHFGALVSSYSFWTKWIALSYPKWNAIILLIRNISGYRNISESNWSISLGDEPKSKIAEAQKIIVLFHSKLKFRKLRPNGSRFSCETIFCWANWNEYYGEVTIWVMIRWILRKEATG